MYSAFGIAEAVSSCVVNSYSFFRHNPSIVRTYGQVIAEDGKITTIRPRNLLKYRVSALSQEVSSKNAESLIEALFANEENLVNISRITRIHNSAVCAENTSDSLLSLWSILESIVEDDKEEPFEDKSGKTSITEKKKERSKIGNIVEHAIPCLKSTYIPKLVQTCMTDVMRWDSDFFVTYIRNNGFGENDLEHMFAFLAFKSTQEARDELYARTDRFPLLRHRVCTLSEQLGNSKGIKSLIKDHCDRIGWHLHRIYRARNYIIHDAKANEALNQELVINLHSYVDIIITKAVELIHASPYGDLVQDALTGHRLAVLIMDERLANQKNEDIDESNAWRYLYYDFER